MSEKQFESDLKIIQSKTDSLCGYVSSSDLNIPLDRLKVLKAKRLINIDRFYENDQKISLTDAGITYFIDKDENRDKAVRSRVETFIFNLLCAAAGSVITLFIQWIVK